MKYLLNLSTAIQDDNDNVNVYSNVIGFYKTIEEAQAAAEADLQKEAEDAAADMFDDEEETQEYIESYLGDTAMYNYINADFVMSPSKTLLEHSYVSDYWQVAHVYAIIRVA